MVSPILHGTDVSLITSIIHIAQQPTLLGHHPDPFVGASHGFGRHVFLLI
jgi:hypothetical protein